MLDPNLKPMTSLSGTLETSVVELIMSLDHLPWMTSTKRLLSMRPLLNALGFVVLKTCWGLVGNMGE